MYAPASDLARAKVRLDLARQHCFLPEEFGGVLGRVDCLLRHLLTLGETTLAHEIALYRDSPFDV